MEILRTTKNDGLNGYTNLCSLLDLKLHLFRTNLKPGFHVSINLKVRPSDLFETMNSTVMMGI